MNTTTESEKITRIGRLVYAKLFDMIDENYLCFVDKDGEYDCKKIFWRFYIVQTRRKNEDKNSKTTGDFMGSNIFLAFTLSEFRG